MHRERRGRRRSAHIHGGVRRQRAAIELASAARDLGGAVDAVGEQLGAVLTERRHRGASVVGDDHAEAAVGEGELLRRLVVGDVTFGPAAGVLPARRRQVSAGDGGRPTASAATTAAVRRRLRAGWGREVSSAELLMRRLGAWGTVDGGDLRVGWHGPRGARARRRARPARSDDTLLARAPHTFVLAAPVACGIRMPVTCGHIRVPGRVSLWQAVSEFVNVFHELSLTERRSLEHR